MGNIFSSINCIWFISWKFDVCEFLFVFGVKNKFNLYLQACAFPSKHQNVNMAANFHSY